MTPGRAPEFLPPLLPMKKVALVTGVGLPLGRAIAATLDEAGFAVVPAGGSAAAPVVLPRLDVLVNAAPLELRALVPAASEWEEAVDDAERVTRALEEPYHAVRTVAPLLRAARGSVVNVLNCPPDPETRAGMGALTQALSRAMAPHVRVNAVVTALLDPESDPPSALDSFTPPMDEVVRTILFLLGAPYVNGETLVVRGC